MWVVLLFRKDDETYRTTKPIASVAVPNEETARRVQAVVDVNVGEDAWTHAVNVEKGSLFEPKNDPFAEDTRWVKHLMKGYRNAH